MQRQCYRSFSFGSQDGSRLIHFSYLCSLSSAILHCFLSGPGASLGLPRADDLRFSAHCVSSV